MHHKDAVQFKPNRIQFIVIQSKYNQIKLIKFQIGPIHTEPIKKKVASLRTPTDCNKTSLRSNPTP